MRMNRSWIFIILGALLIIAGISLYSYFGLDQASPPRIEIAPSSYDFGVIPYQAVERSFIVRNIGGSTLRITGLSTSCGCTRAEIEEEELLPGEETELLVTFDPNLMSERLEGKVYRVVYVKSNDPEQPEAEIEIWATLEESDES
jgi:hypothetical protein